MPLTNAQLQARHRAKRKAQLQRYEAALREIATPPNGSMFMYPRVEDQPHVIARAALQEPEA